MRQPKALAAAAASHYHLARMAQPHENESRPTANSEPSLGAADTGLPRPSFWARARRLTARFGVAGFLFFLVKGLLWLAIPALLAKKALEY